MSQAKLTFIAVVVVLGAQFGPDIFGYFSSIDLDGMTIVTFAVALVFGGLRLLAAFRFLNLPSLQKISESVRETNDTPFTDIFDFFVRFALPTFGVFMLINLDTEFSSADIPYVNDAYEPFLFLAFVAYSLIAILRKTHGKRIGPRISGPITTVRADYGMPFRIAYIASGTVCGAIILLIMNAMMSTGSDLDQFGFVNLTDGPSSVAHTFQ